MTAEQRLDAWTSTPIFNVMRGNLEYCAELSADRLRLCQQYRTQDEHCVQWLKRALGKQDYCWNGEYRYWVWEYSLPGVHRQAARIYASNIHGWSFEVNVSLTPEQAMLVWRDFIKTVEK